MSYKLFLFLLRCMRFDDKSTRPSRVETDKLLTIRAVLDKFVDNYKTRYSPGEFLTIDEKLALSHHPKKSEEDVVFVVGQKMSIQVSSVQ